MIYSFTVRFDSAHIVWHQGEACPTVTLAGAGAGAGSPAHSWLCPEHCPAKWEPTLEGNFYQTWEEEENTHTRDASENLILIKNVTCSENTLIPSAPPYCNRWNWGSVTLNEFPPNSGLMTGRAGSTNKLWFQPPLPEACAHTHTCPHPTVPVQTSSHFPRLSRKLLPVHKMCAPDCTPTEPAFPASEYWDTPHSTERAAQPFPSASSARPELTGGLLHSAPRKPTL